MRPRLRLVEELIVPHIAFVALVLRARTFQVVAEYGDV
jgi:hypothetical protein